jgi:ribosomal protein S18 acetylase RimI-like enzyme
VGDALMQTSIKECHSHGYLTVWLSSWELNDRANAFYKKWGFKVDMAAKRHKKHKNKISHLIISIDYEIEIR